ncbi:MAG: glycoside hydrolase family 55 protein [Halanaerobiales bacterium]|nr:glycoside hydrolase family 55 protein [Halanaerobiales bacterium]
MVQKRILSFKIGLIIMLFVLGSSLTVIADEDIPFPRLDWRLIETNYPTEQPVVAGYSVKDFGAKGDGVTDDTARFQRGLDILGMIGGGTLFVPEGRYVIKSDLTIPPGVTLQGDWLKPEAGKAVKGTILMAYAGRGNDQARPFITIAATGSINGITIWYPEQTADQIVPYPLTLKINASWVKNVTLINSYHGISTGPEMNGCYMLENIYGTPLTTGIEIDGTADVGRTHFVDFSPKYWSESGLPGSPSVNGPHVEWIYQHGTAFVLRRQDWSYLTYVAAEGYNKGVHCKESDCVEEYENRARTGRKIHHSFPNGQCYGISLTGCKTGIYIDGASYAGMLFTKIEIKNAETGIMLTDDPHSEGGIINFHSCTIDGSDYAINNQGLGKVFIQQSMIKQGQIYTDNGSLNMVNCDIKSTTPQITLAGSRPKTTFTGNSFKYDPVIQNNSDAQPLIDHTTVQGTGLSEFPPIKLQRHGPARLAFYNVTREPFNAKNDLSTDCTEAIQSALDQAGSEGGGIVFLPAGKYRVLGNLFVPSGVELMGAATVSHKGRAIGSRIFVYNGQGEAEGAPFLKLAAQSGVRGVTFTYPEQRYDNIQPYPYTIQSLGSDVYIINVTVRNTYNAVDLFTNRSDRHYVDYLSGQVWNNTVRVGAGSTGGAINNIQMNWGSLLFGRETQWGEWEDSPPLAETKYWGDVLSKYLAENCDHIILGDCSEQILYNNFSIFGRKGVYLKDDHGRGPSGWCLGQGVDVARQPVYLAALGEKGMDFINTQLVNTYRNKYDDAAYITLSARFEQTANFYNLACWGSTELSAIVKNGTLNLQLATFNITGKPAFIAEGEINIINSHLRNSGKLLDDNWQNLSVLSSVYRREIREKDWLKEWKNNRH